jgi:hypothetical protein
MKCLLVNSVLPRTRCNGIDGNVDHLHGKTSKPSSITRLRQKECSSDQIAGHFGVLTLERILQAPRSCYSLAMQILVAVRSHSASGNSIRNAMHMHEQFPVPSSQPLETNCRLVNRSWFASEASSQRHFKRFEPEPGVPSTYPNQPKADLTHFDSLRSATAN